jgi:hypothetical protein
MGSAAADEGLRRAAIANFHEKASRRTPNWRFVQPVTIEEAAAGDDVHADMAKPH